MSRLFLAALAEGGIDFVFLDAGRGIAGLAEILLFGAVAHHAGMLVGGLAILMRGLGIGLVAHDTVSRRGCARPNDPKIVRFRFRRPGPCGFERIVQTHCLLYSAHWRCPREARNSP